MWFRKSNSHIQSEDSLESTASPTPWNPSSSQAATDHHLNHSWFHGQYTFHNTQDSQGTWTTLVACVASWFEAGKLREVPTPLYQKQVTTAKTVVPSVLLLHRCHHPAHKTVLLVHLLCTRPGTQCLTCNVLLRLSVMSSEKVIIFVGHSKIREQLLSETTSQMFLFS